MSGTDGLAHSVFYVWLPFPCLSPILTDVPAGFPRGIIAKGRAVMLRCSSKATHPFPLKLNILGLRLTQIDF